MTTAIEIAIAAVVLAALIVLSEFVAQTALLVGICGLAAYFLASINYAAPLTPYSAAKLAAGCWLAWGALRLGRWHWQIWRGLNQWPDPKGRYYSRWLDLPDSETTCGYYEWLARQKGCRQPWAAWAEAARNAENSIKSWPQ